MAVFTIRRLNNRAENSHQPTRQKERQMRRFKSAGYAQRFLSAFEPLRGYFRLRRHKRAAVEYRAERTQRFQNWKQLTGVEMAA
jgi:putative transposase